MGGGSAQQDQSPALSCCVSYDLYDLRSELPIVCLARLLVSPGSCRPMALPGSRRVIVAREAPQMHGPQLWMARDGAGAQGGRRQHATPWRLGGVARRVLCVKNARPLIPSTTACSPCHMSWCGLRPDTLWQRWDGVLGWLGGWWVTGGFVGGLRGGAVGPLSCPGTPGTWCLVPLECTCPEQCTVPAGPPAHPACRAGVSRVVGTGPSDRGSCRFRDRPGDAPTWVPGCDGLPLPYCWSSCITYVGRAPMGSVPA